MGMVLVLLLRSEGKSARIPLKLKLNFRLAFASVGGTESEQTIALNDVLLLVL